MLVLREASGALLGPYRSSTRSVPNAIAVRDASGMVRLTKADRAGSDADLASRALTSDLSLQHESEQMILLRRPSPIVVLLFDELQGVFVESAAVELGRDHLILVAADRTDEVRMALKSIAAPGFSVLDESTIVPHGWALFTDVSIRTMRDDLRGDLHALQPRSRTQVEFRGGMQLSNGRWHSSAPPDVIVVDSREREFLVTLYDELGSSADDSRNLGKYQREALISLPDEHLGDGNYRIVITDAKNEVHVTSRALKLRSATSAHLDPRVDLQFAYIASPDFDSSAAVSATAVAQADPPGLRGALIDQRQDLRRVPDAQLHSSLGAMEAFESIETWVTRVYGKLTEPRLAEAHEHLRRGTLSNVTAAPVDGCRQRMAWRSRNDERPTRSPGQPLEWSGSARGPRPNSRCAHSQSGGVVECIPPLDCLFGL